MLAYLLQEKQARKAARSANKKSLQKFLNDVNPSSPTTAPENPEVANEIEPVSNEGDQDTNEDLKTAEVESKLINVRNYSGSITGCMCRSISC